jgi:trypsin
MKNFVQVVLVLASCSLNFALPRHIIRILPDNRIVGGHDDVIENVPWQISLQRNGAHHCGGSILNQNTILTAAHCVE